MGKDFLMEIVIATDCQFRKPCNAGRKRCTADAHDRKTKQAKDQDRISDQIDDKSSHADPGGKHHPLTAFHRGKIRLGKAHAEIGKRNNSKILRPFRNQRRITGPKQQNLLRDHKGKQRSRNGKQCRYDQSDPEDRTDRLIMLFPPVLTGKDRNGRRQSEIDDRQYKIHLTGQGTGRQCGLGYSSQHDRIREVHKVGDQALNDDRDHKNRQFSDQSFSELVPVHREKG